MHAGNQIKRYRESKTPKQSQAALAKEIGVARLTVVRWETGDRRIDESKLSRVSEVTGIPPKELRPDLVEKLEELLGSSQ